MVKTSKNFTPQLLFRVEFFWCLGFQVYLIPIARKILNPPLTIAVRLYRYNTPNFVINVSDKILTKKLKTPLDDKNKRKTFANAEYKRDFLYAYIFDALNDCIAS